MRVSYVISGLFIALTILIAIGPSITLIASASSQTPTTLTTAVVTSTPTQNMQTYNPNPFAIGGGLFGSYAAGPQAGVINVLSFIINFSNNNEIVPIVFENWTISPSNLTYVYYHQNQIKSFNITIYFRHDFYWANGQPVTAWDWASDVMITFASYAAFNAFISIKVIDNYTAVITFPSRVVSNIPELFVNYLASNGWPIRINYNLYKPLVQQLMGNWTLLYNYSQGMNVTPKPNVTAFIAKIQSYNPVAIYGQSAILASANGPFYVSQITPAEVILAKNPYYPYKNMIPWNQIVVYQYTSYSSLLAALKSGEIDFLYGLPPQYFSLLPSYYRILLVPQPYGSQLYFNFKNPWLANVLVRQAIAYILNRTAIAEAGGQIYQPIPFPGAMPTILPAWAQEYGPWENQYINPYNTNWTKATQLLQEAGFTYKNGQWYTPNGTPFTLTIAGFYVTGQDQQNILNTIAAELTAFGIKTVATIVNAPSVVTSMYNSGNGYDIAWNPYSYGGVYGASFNWGDGLWGAIFGLNISHTIMTGFVPASLWANSLKDVTSYANWSQYSYYVIFDTNNKTLDNLVGEQNVKLFNGKNMTIVSLWVAGAAQGAVNDMLANIWGKEASVVLNYYLPVLPILYTDIVYVYNSQTVSLPPANSWVWLESFFVWDNEGAIQELLDLGLMVPANMATSSSSISVSTTTTTSTSSATTSTTNTSTLVVPPTVITPTTNSMSTSVSSTGVSSTVIYGIVAVIVIVIIVLAVLFIVRRR